MCMLAGMFMGGTAELLAEKYNISREEQDAFALESHQKAAKAAQEGKFKDEIYPGVKQKKKQVVVDTDEIPRADTSLEKMAKLLPCLRRMAGRSLRGTAGALAIAPGAGDHGGRKGQSAKHYPWR